MPTFRKRSTLLTVLLLTASAASHAQTAAIDPDWPNWLQRGMQQEARVPRMNTFEADNGQYRFRLPHTAELITEGETMWGYMIDIGSELPVVCNFYNEDKPMTYTAVTTGEAAIESLIQSRNFEQENLRSLYHLDAGSLDGTVFLALEWLSSFATEDGDVLGHTKVRAATNGEIVHVCWHREVGYRETLDEIFATFVRSTRYTSEYAEPFAEDITVDTTNGQVTGATYSSLTQLDNGQFESYSYTTSILPVAPGEIQYSDSYYTEYSTADGAIVSSYVYSVDNGEPSMELFLERDTSGESDNWLVSGEVQGTQVELQIPPVDGLKGEMTLLEETRELFAGDGESLEALVWAPFLDPTTFMELTFERDDDEVPYQGIARLGPVEMITVSDEHGGAVSGRMSIGPNTIAFERVWTQGIPTPPVTKQ